MGGGDWLPGPTVQLKETAFDILLFNILNRNYQIGWLNEGV